MTTAYRTTDSLHSKSFLQWRALRFGGTSPTLVSAFGGQADRAVIRQARDRVYDKWPEELLFGSPTPDCDTAWNHHDWEAYARLVLADARILARALDAAEAKNC